MLTFAIICLAFTLIGVVGLQFTYLFYVDRINKSQKRHIKQLERRIASLRTKLTDADRVIDEYYETLAAANIYTDTEPEWDDIIVTRHDL